MEDLNLETVLAKRRAATAEGGRDVADRFLAWAEGNDADTVVVGATEEGLLRQALFGAIPEEVGEHFDGTVLMVRKHLPFRSTLRGWVRRWLGRRRSRDDGEAVS